MMTSTGDSHAEQREATLATEAAGWDTTKVEKAQPGDIPTIDITGLLDASGAANPELSQDQKKRMAAELGAACREVGFFSLVGHGLSAQLIADMFGWARRFHALDAEIKLALSMASDGDGHRAGSPQGVGYLPLMHQKLPRRSRGNNNEAFIVKRDRHLTLVNNLWPEETVLPGFRTALERYAGHMENLAVRLLPLYATSLGVAADFFDKGFVDPLYRLRLTHYPSDRSAGYGIAPHVDTTFLTILAQDTDGLVVYSERRGCWISVPLVEGALVVNTGELLKQWTNDEFLSVKHFANNSGAVESRYSIPFFFNATSDYPMACVPTCMGPNRPAKYPTLSYAESQGVVQGE